MCQSAAADILRDLERREVASDEVSPWAFPQSVQQFLLAFVGTVSDKTAPANAPTLPIGFLASRIRPENQRRSFPGNTLAIYLTRASVQ